MPRLSDPFHLPDCSMRLIVIPPRPQDTANGAQLAGSWAVRETFVAVCTTNLPMLWKFLRFVVSPLLGSFKSRSRSDMFGSRMNKRSKMPSSGVFQLQDVPSTNDKLSNKRGPASLYPTTVFSESEERIMKKQGQPHSPGIKVDTMFEVSIKSESMGSGRSKTDRISEEAYITSTSVTTEAYSSAKRKTLLST